MFTDPSPAEKAVRLFACCTFLLLITGVTCNSLIRRNEKALNNGNRRMVVALYQWAPVDYTRPLPCLLRQHLEELPEMLAVDLEEFR